MNLLTARIGVLFVPTTALWSGTVDSYAPDSYTLTVTTTGGDITDVEAGLAVQTADYELARIKSTTATTITLAENGLDFVSGDALTVSGARFPFPKYQVVTPEGVLLKDGDVAYPGKDDASPPVIIIDSEALWLNESPYGASLTAEDSYAITPLATMVNFAWDAGAGSAVVTSGTYNENCVASFTTTGFRYMKITGTDSNGAVSVRYIPIWVGIDPFERLSSGQLDYTLDKGWQADITVQAPDTLLKRSPVALVDMDSAEVVFYGWMGAQNATYNYENDELSFAAYGPLSYAGQLHSYPFIIEDNSSPSSWSEIEDLTLARALLFFLHWQTNLLELANVDVPNIITRRIAGQEFPAGTVLSQLNTVGSAAFWAFRATRSGGITVAEHPLYSTAFDAGETYNLTDGDSVIGALRRERRGVTINEARLEGVYYSSGNYEPAIVRSPSHPADLGSPTEARGLAPLNATELRRWAARHVGLSNSSDQYTGIVALPEINPDSYEAVTLPDSASIALEEVRLTFTGGALAWQQRIGGRTRGVDASVEFVPLPDPVEVPRFGDWDPGETVPEIIVPVALDAGVVVAFNTTGGTPELHYTADLTETTPTWTELTNFPGSGNVWTMAVAGGDSANSGALFVTTDEPALYRCADLLADSWETISTPSGYGFGGYTNRLPRVMVNPSRNGQLLVNIYATGDDFTAYAWVIDGSGVTLQGPDEIGQQTVPGARHLTWYDALHYFAGVDDAAAPVGDLETIEESGGTIIPSGDSYSTNDPVSTGLTTTTYATAEMSEYAYAFASVSCSVNIENSGFGETRCSVDTSFRTYGDAAILIGDTWVTSVGSFTDLKSGFSDIPASGSGGASTLANVLMRIKGDAVDPEDNAVQLRYSAGSNRSGLPYSFTEGSVFWEEISSGGSSVQLYHLQVPQGYAGDMADLLENTCQGQADSGDCALTGFVRACPDWATEILARLPDYAWLMQGSDGDADLSLDSDGGPCGDPVDGADGADPPIDASSQGLNVVSWGSGSCAALNMALNALLVSSDGLQTATSETIPSALDRAGASLARFTYGGNQWLVVSGSGGVQVYDLVAGTWTDKTGALTPPSTTTPVGYQLIVSVGG